MTKWTSTSRQPPAKNIRRWLAIGVAGLFVVLALPSVWDVWQIDRAGVVLNRAIVTGADAAAQLRAAQAGGTEEQADTSSAARITIIAGGDYLVTAAVEAGLEQALALMEDAASRGPHTAAREGPMWRTYGAAARILPSDHAFELLLRSRNAGRLDWLGELSLGEVASATGHWDEAAEAYRRVDVSNLLIYRAEAHLQTGDKELALRELALAKVSLDAAADRERAERLLLDRTGNEPSELEGMMQRPAERATALSRIGQGLLSLGRPLEALPVLEQGLALAATASPGVTVQRNLRLDLAAALTATLPERVPNDAVSTSYAYFYDKGRMKRLQGIIRVESLITQTLALERTAPIYARAGRILLAAGDESRGVSLLSEAMTLDPLAPEAYVAMGEWYERSGLAFLAQRLYLQAAERMPDDPAIATALAISTYQTVGHQEALPLLERATSLEISDPRVFLYLGDCYQESARSADALAAWQEGLRRSPGSELLKARVAAMEQAWRRTE